MRWVLVAAMIALAFTPSATLAHPYSVTCTMYAPNPDQADTGLVSLVESIAPGAVPNGLFYCYVRGVQGGDAFTITSDPEPQAFVVGTADECPGPDTFEPTDPSWWLNDFWVICNNPEFDIKFTGGAYAPGPGDEIGMVPGDGDAIISMLFGMPGTTVTYREDG